MQSGRAYVPNVDVIEQDDRLLLLADVPGVTRDAVSVNYEQGLLSIHAGVAPRQDTGHRQFLVREYGVGDFYRVFEVGEGIEASKIEAELHDGVLTVHLPKTQEVRPRRIEVKPT